MKSIAYQFISLSVFLAVMFAATTVFAQTEEPTETEADVAPTIIDANAPERREAIDAIRQEVSERLDSVQENITERRDAIEANTTERRAAITAQIQTRIINLAANISNRLEAAVGRIENITGRLESRIEKLRTTGIDTSAAEAELQTVRDAITRARTTLATIDGAVSTSISSEDPRTTWQSTKATFIAIREDIRSAHTALRAAVAALKVAITVPATTPDETAGDEAGTESTTNE